MNTDEEDFELDQEALGDEEDGADTTPRASAPTSEEGEDNENESFRHRLEVRQGKQREARSGDDAASIAETVGKNNSKQMDQGLQELWIMVNEKSQELGKTPAHALEDAGFVISLSRRPNSWNVFRTWLCLQPQCPPGT